jgi:hypothetical protein
MKKNELNTELLILPDGRILVQNLTRTFAELLKELNPDDEQILPRTARQMDARPVSP